MSGSSMFAPRRCARALTGSGDDEQRSRHVLRGAGLTLAFVTALAAGAVTDSWGTATGNGSSPVSPRTAGGDVPDHQDDAEELVSRSGDRWSTAYTAREYEGLRRALHGEYVGIGVSVRRLPSGGFEIARVQPGGPAARAGVRHGDRLRAVDGAEVADLPVTDVVALLRGAPEEGAGPGSRVVLDLDRDGRRRQEVLRRTRLTVETVTVTRLDSGVTRIGIDAFTKGSGERVRRAVEAVPADAGMLLDLRGNSGGLVVEATEAASAFLDGGLVATYGEGDDQRALYADAGGNTGSPLVVLVDSGTMSAAELLAGALRDRGRAVLVGTRTFGKGSVQVPQEQPDGSVAELTVGQYTTPGGRTVEDEGLTPDLVVRPGEDAQEEALTVLSGLATRS